MDARKILRKTDRVTVLIDSPTFNDLLKKDHREAWAILDYKNSNEIMLVRTPEKVEIPELSDLRSYQTYFYKDSEDIHYLHVGIPAGEWKIGFGYKQKDILTIAKEIHDKPEISQQEFEAILKVFTMACFNKSDNHNIMITNNDVLLTQRYWFESNFPSKIVNIMTLNEASKYLDLHLKNKGLFLAKSNYQLNKGLWYWHSMRLKLPNYNVGDLYIDALAQRFYYALMAVDEIGMQHYSGSNNDTVDLMLYHFNYLITLTTGIFDNLALHSNDYFGIKEQNLIRVSLNNSDFLKQIRDNNQKLRDHITQHIEYIRLIYELREVVVHREMFQDAGVRFSDGNYACEINAFQTTGKVKERLKHLQDAPQKYDFFSEWGFYEFLPDRLYIEPYHFSIRLISVLTEFVNTYLQLLDYPNFIQEKRKEPDGYTHTMTAFEQYHLGL